jgi:Xaa-Pro aminopeptidase
MIHPIGYDENRASKFIRENELQGIFLTLPENVYYFTGAPVLPGTGNPILFALRNNIPSYAYLDSEGKVTLFVWFGVTMGIDFSASEVRSYADLNGSIEELTAFINEKLNKDRKIGVESSCSYIVTDLLNKTGIKFEIVDNLISRLRMIKTKDEILYLQKSIKIAESAILDIKNKIKIGVTRKELANFIRTMMMENGAMAIDHLTIAFGASNPEVLIDESLKERQIITMDLGAVYEGYVSDIRRLFYSSAKVPIEINDLYKKMVQIVDEVGLALKPGMKFGAVYDIASDLYRAAGLEPMFISVGHSIGILTEESLILPDSEIDIENNMVLNVELYTPDENGVMIGDEETYLIENGKSIRLTKLERIIFTI